MRLKKIRIENVKGFLGARFASEIDLGPGRPGWFVFAGRNGAGKSSLLRATALALAGPRAAEQLMPSFAHWIRKGPKAARVSVDFSRAPEDRLERRAKVGVIATTAGLEWIRSPAGPEPRLSVAAGTRGDVLREGLWGDNPRGWLVLGYGPFRRPPARGSLEPAALVGSPHRRRLAGLFDEDRPWLDLEPWLKDLQLRALEKRNGAERFLDHVLELLNDGLLPDGARVDRVDADGIWVDRGGATLPLGELSDGYRVALAFVLDLVRNVYDAYGQTRIGEKNGRIVVRAPAVVLVDEIDAHLHVSWQQRIGFWLQERFPEAQFLVTTHSPFIAQAASPRGLFRLPSPGEERGVEQVDEDTYKRVVNGGADDAVLSSLFGLERSTSPRAAGLKEEYSKLWAEQLVRKLPKAKKARLAELEAQLPLPYESGSGR